MATKVVKSMRSFQKWVGKAEGGKSQVKAGDSAELWKQLGKRLAREGQPVYGERGVVGVIHPIIPMLIKNGARLLSVEKAKRSRARKKK